MVLTFWKFVKRNSQRRKCRVNHMWPQSLKYWPPLPKTFVDSRHRGWQGVKSLPCPQNPKDMSKQTGRLACRNSIVAESRQWASTDSSKTIFPYTVMNSRGVTWWCRHRCHEDPQDRMEPDCASAGRCAPAEESRAKGSAPLRASSEQARFPLGAHSLKAVTLCHPRLLNWLHD